MQSYEGYFENGRFYTAGRIVHIPDRRIVTVNISEDEVKTGTHSQKQLAAFKRFVNANRAVTGEPVDEKFDEILSRGISIGALEL